MQKVLKWDLGNFRAIEKLEEWEPFVRFLANAQKCLCACDFQVEGRRPVAPRKIETKIITSGVTGFCFR